MESHHLIQGHALPIAREETAPLLALLTNPRSRPPERAVAVRLLAELGDPAAIPVLLPLLQNTNNPFLVQVVSAVLTALPRFGEQAIPYYQDVLAGQDAERRIFMPRLLADTGAVERVVPLLIECLDDRQMDVAVNAAAALGTLRVASAADRLVDLLADDQRAPALRGVAASALGMVGDGRAFDLLAALLSASATSAGDDEVLAGLIDGLAELRDRRAIPLLHAVLRERVLTDGVQRGIRLALLSLQMAESPTP